MVSFLCMKLQVVRARVIRYIQIPPHRLKGTSLWDVLGGRSFQGQTATSALERSEVRILTPLGSSAEQSRTGVD